MELNLLGIWSWTACQHSNWVLFIHLFVFMYMIYRRILHSDFFISCSLQLFHDLTHLIAEYFSFKAHHCKNQRRTHLDGITTRIWRISDCYRSWYVQHYYIKPTSQSFQYLQDGSDSTQLKCLQTGTRLWVIPTVISDVLIAATIIVCHFVPCSHSNQSMYTAPPRSIQNWTPPQKYLLTCLIHQSRIYQQSTCSYLSSVMRHSLGKTRVMSFGSVCFFFLLLFWQDRDRDCMSGPLYSNILLFGSSWKWYIFLTWWRGKNSVWDLVWIIIESFRNCVGKGDNGCVEAVREREGQLFFPRSN